MNRSIKDTLEVVNFAGDLLTVVSKVTADGHVGPAEIILEGRNLIEPGIMAIAGFQKVPAEILDLDGPEWEALSLALGRLTLAAGRVVPLRLPLVKRDRTTPAKVDNTLEVLNFVTDVFACLNGVLADGKVRPFEVLLKGRKLIKPALEAFNDAGKIPVELADLDADEFEAIRLATGRLKAEAGKLLAKARARRKALAIAA